MLKITNIKNVFILYKNNKFLYMYNKNYFNHYYLKFIDIMYTGKTYKWKINKILLKFIFNRAHITHVYNLKKIKYSKLSKNKFRFFLIQNINYFYFKNIVYKIRKYNIFTHRGIKIRNSFFFKKKGKISSYKKCLIFEIYFLFLFPLCYYFF